ncbi:immediate early response gene 2 protein [Lates calcarifer]|uniref:Immediate early response gene 2 protein n=1 Tax=Lates calcarifer TaxID=8187 RepID=A0AAJ7LN96_LATCA|nr:immediate early response gene 2 protein [Lates calcarifer]
MEVSAEAKRIMVVALGKLYSSRSQRGGLRLHRSLLLTLVMKSARDMYHAAQATAESVAPGCEEQQQHHQQEEEHPAAQTTPEPTGAHVEFQGPPSLVHRRASDFAPTGAENKENQCPTGPAQHSRKRRGKAAAEPDFLPCKKAKLEQGNCSQQLIVNPVLVDYANCSSGLGSTPTPMPLLRAIAAC